MQSKMTIHHMRRIPVFTWAEFYDIKTEAELITLVRDEKARREWRQKRLANPAATMMTMTRLRHLLGFGAPPSSSSTPPPSQ
jgi:hypothetical protein